MSSYGSRELENIGSTSDLLGKRGYEILERIQLYEDFPTVGTMKMYFKVKHPLGMILFAEEKGNEPEWDFLTYLKYEKVKEGDKSISRNLKNGIFEDCNKNSAVILKDKMLSLVLQNNESAEPIIEDYEFMSENSDMSIEGYFIFPLVTTGEIQKDAISVDNHVLIMTACLRKCVINRIERHQKAFKLSNQKIEEQIPRYEEAKTKVATMLAEKIDSAYEDAMIEKSKEKVQTARHNTQRSRESEYLSLLNDVGLVYLDEISKIERMAKEMRKLEQELKQSTVKLNEIKQSYSSTS